MIRHTFATDMLNSGADLITVKELLGHENIDTTSIYTHITDEQIKTAYISLIYDYVMLKTQYQKM